MMTHNVFSNKLQARHIIMALLVASLSLITIGCGSEELEGGEQGWDEDIYLEQEDSEEASPITIDTDQGLGNLVTSGSDDADTLRQFAEEYTGRVIEIDAYCCRCDILSQYYRAYYFAPGTEDSYVCAQFVMNHIGYPDLNWVRSDDHESPTHVESPTYLNVHVIARITGFDEETNLVGIEPVKCWLL